MAMAVTATQGGSTANGLLLRVEVLTQAVLAATPATGSQSGGGAVAAQCSITTTTAGSLVYGALVRGQAGAYTAAAGCTLIDNVSDATNGEQYGTFKTTSPTVTPGTITAGSSAPTASTTHGAAAIEILAAGTITTDPSSPPVASSTSAITVSTATFTPPPGSLLVAMVSSDGGPGVTTMTVSGGGLTWTQLAAGNTTNSDYAGVWTAQTAPPAPLRPQRQPARARLVPPRRGIAGGLRAAPAAAAAGPAVTPLTQPVRARQPLPLRGMVRGIAGAALVVSVLGPPLRPAHGPVATAARGLPPAGRVTGIAHPLPQPPGAFQRVPARARLPFPPPRGRVLTLRPAAPSQAPTPGPALSPAHAPVRAQLPARGQGRAAAIIALPSVLAPTSGPAPRPLTQPARARLPYPVLRGRAVSAPLRPVLSQGPSFVPLGQPAGSRAVFWRAGAAQSLPGQVPSVLGPPVTPLTRPVRARQPLPPPGTARTMAILHTGYSGPAPAPLRSPAGLAYRAPGPQRYGRAAGLPGARSGLGPPPPARSGPVRAQPASTVRGRTLSTRLAPPPPAPTAGPPLRRLSQPAGNYRLPPSLPGRAASVTAIFVPFTPASGPALTPQRGPVRARQPLPAPGRAMAVQSVAVPPHTGPAFTPLTAPVRARQPLAAPGRAMAVQAIPQPFIPAAIPPAGQPAGSRVILTRAGHVQRTLPAQSILGPPVTPLTRPVRAAFPLPPPGRAASVVRIPVIPVPPGPPPPAGTLNLRPGLVVTTPAAAQTLVTTASALLTITQASAAAVTVSGNEGTTQAVLRPPRPAVIPPPDAVTVPVTRLSR